MVCEVRDTCGGVILVVVGRRSLGFRGKGRLEIRLVGF